MAKVQVTTPDGTECDYDNAFWLADNAGRMDSSGVLQIQRVNGDGSRQTIASFAEWVSVVDLDA